MSSVVAQGWSGLGYLPQEARNLWRGRLTPKWQLRRHDANFPVASGAGSSRRRTAAPRRERSVRCYARRGIYSSPLATWRKQRVATERAVLAPKKRGRQADPALAEARREEGLVRENKRADGLEQYQMAWLKVQRYRRGWMTPAHFTLGPGEPDA